MMKNNEHAFSLLELLVAISIFTLLLLLVIEVSHAGLQLWRRSEQSQQTTREARAALQLISKDLGSAVILTNQVTLFCDVATCDPTCQQNIFFLASMPRQARPHQDLGDLHLIGYFLIPDQHSKNQTYDLYRFIWSCDETRNALTQGSLLELAQTASSTNTLQSEHVAANISDFQAAPRWLYHGEFSQNPPNREKEASFFTPSLVEIKITATDATGLQNQTFTTSIALSSENKF